MAAACDKAAQAYASELSTSKDPVSRERLGKKARQQKQQAEFHRQKAAELSGSRPGNE
jgi:hypothetical protein